MEKGMFYVGEPSLEKVPPHPLQEHLSVWLGAKSFARLPVLMQAPAELGPMSQFALASLVSLDITLSTLHFFLPLPYVIDVRLHADPFISPTLSHRFLRNICTLR